jgi:N6-L-threonylcarbamoyladenine synthase
MKAAIFLKYKSIVVSGGAAANILLRKKLKKECNYRNIKLFIPSLGLCSDNASMVGSQGYYEFLKGNLADLSLNALFRV